LLGNEADFAAVAAGLKALSVPAGGEWAATRSSAAWKFAAPPLHFQKAKPEMLIL
jgi:hypothetical protein